MYDVSRLVTICLPNYDYGDGASVDVTSFTLPPGFAGRLIDIGIAATETFACDATPASISVGTATDPDAYGKLNIADATADTNYFNSADDTDAIIASYIPAGTQIEITPAVGVDSGTEAGKGLGYILIEIYKQAA
jgi:hypothetical protein